MPASCVPLLSWKRSSLFRLFDKRTDIPLCDSARFQGNTLSVSGYFSPSGAGPWGADIHNPVILYESFSACRQSPVAGLYKNRLFQISGNSFNKTAFPGFCLLGATLELFYELSICQDFIHLDLVNKDILIQFFFFNNFYYIIYLAFFNLSRSHKLFIGFICHSQGNCLCHKAPPLNGN